MKKIVFFLFLFFFSITNCHGALKSNEINILNLKENNMYILTLDSKALNVDISRNKAINVYPITSITNDGEQVFIDAKKTGVFDVGIKTEKDDYRIRIVVGSTFEDITDDLTVIDLPVSVEGK